MSDARAEVFASIRRSLGVTGKEATRRLAAETRLSQAPRGVVPARGQVDREARIALLEDRAVGAHATIAVLDTMAEAPAEVARFLRDNNAPATIRMGDDPDLAALPWTETALTLANGRSHGDDLNAVSRAFAAVAETGTLALVSGTANPTTLNFLPDNHVVIVRADDVVGDAETVFDRLRDAYGPTTMPRTVNFITGPSRSGDIEQMLVLGAHGPRRLHIVVVR